MTQARMDQITRGLPSKAAKIRALGEAGYKRSEIASYLNVRYQHVRNVLVHAAKAQEVSAKGGSSAPMGGIANRTKLRVGPEGRILIPAPLRNAMQIEEGASVLAWLEDGELRVVGPKVAMRRAQALASEFIAGNDSLAEELIKERREEAKAEETHG